MNIKKDLIADYVRLQEVGCSKTLKLGDSFILWNGRRADTFACYLMKLVMSMAYYQQNMSALAYPRKVSGNKRAASDFEKK